VSKPGTLTPKQARFIEEYLVDLNATAAATRAGYSPRSAYTSGYENLKNPIIVAALKKAQSELSRRTELSQEWVVGQLVENVARAMTAIPVYDRDGEPTGEYRYEGQVANRALELLGKHLGMFTDKLHVSGSLEVVTVDWLDRKIAELSARHAEHAALDEAATT
jgi:phage terminase small subunit